MTDDRSLDMTPRPEFADRLERALLDELAPRRQAPPTHAPPTHPTEHIMTIGTDGHPDLPSPRPRWLIVAATVAAAAVFVVGVVLVAGRGGTREPAASASSQTTASRAKGAHTVTFVARWKHSDVVHECPTDHDRAMCFNRFDMPATTLFSGNLEGYGYQAVFWNDRAETADGTADHLEHIAAYNIFANVAGCGGGEFMLMEMLQYRSGPNRDLNTGTYVGTWQIVADSGRGTLSTISGSGTSSGIVGTAPTAGRTFTGTISCP